MSTRASLITVPRGLVVALAAATLLAAVVPTAPVVAQARRPHPAGVSDAATFAAPLPAVGPAVNARMAANGQLRAHAAQWGLDPGDLTVQDVAVGGAGGRTVRYGQVIDGVPVLGSLVSLTLGKSGELLSMTSQTSAAPAAAVRMSPSQARAALVASTAPGVIVANLRLAIADQRMLPTLGSGSHYVWGALVSGWLQSPQEVYLSDVTGALIAHASTLRDAVDTTPLVCDNGFKHAKFYADDPGSTDPLEVEPTVCAASMTVSSASQLVNGTTPMGVSDVARLVGPHGAIQRTLDYYSTYLGLDVAAERFLGNIAPDRNYGYMYDSALPSAQACDAPDPTVVGGVCSPRISIVLNACDNLKDFLGNAAHGCPYMQNAFWAPWTSSACASGFCSAVYFGSGWAVDDVVAHEITHSVTAEEFPPSTSAETDGLVEAYSDFIGEAVDQMWVDPGEVADPTWGFGEDIGKQVGDYKRYSSDLGFTGYTYLGPARTLAGVRGDEYQTVFNGWDRSENGHRQLGPADRFAWLIANGGTQGGWTITGLGTEPVHAGNANGLCDLPGECTGMVRMTQLVMAALPKLSASATYFEFARAVIQACSDLTALAVAGFTSASCAQVKSALTATRIWKINVGAPTTLAPRSAGVTSTIRARVLTSTGAPATGLRVSLQLRRRTSGVWRTVSTRSVDTNGNARFSVVFSASQYYRVVTRASTTTPSAYSSAKRVLVN